jgi:hypothetical protein
MKMKRLDYSLIPEKFHADAGKIESILRSCGFDVELTKNQSGALRVAKGCKSVYFKFSGKSKLDHDIYETLLFESEPSEIDEFLFSGKLSDAVVESALMSKAGKVVLSRELNIPCKDDYLDAVEHLYNPAKRN